MRTRTLRIALFALIALLSSSTYVFAQNYRAVFTASTNHSTVENGVQVVSDYVLLIYAPSASTPQTLSLGKPTPDASNTISVDVNSTLSQLPASTSCNTSSPSATTCYTVRVRANGPGGSSDSSLSLPFTLVPRAPAAPGQPTVNRPSSTSASVGTGTQPTILLLPSPTSLFSASSSASTEALSERQRSRLTRLRSR